MRHIASAVGRLLTATVLSIAAAAPLAPAPALDFRIDEGRNINSFVRDGDVAAHLVLRSGRTPRIIVAFPAGNSGVGVWFAETATPITWRVVRSPRPSRLSDSKGRPLRGIQAEVEVDAPRLSVSRAVLSSVRVLRDYEALGTAPESVSIPQVQQANRLSWTRDRLDGGPGYLLSIEALDGASIDSSGAIANGSGDRVRLKITALTGETPLTPLGGESLLTAKADEDARARNALAFLSYEEKFLAGSWRFNTYFGRDTLISLTLLAPVLQPAALESGIASVLSRLAPNGEVAHEEDIGEFAVLRNEKEGRRSAAPIYDYAMVDDDFLLGPVVANCLLDTPVGRARAPSFLATRNPASERQGDALVRNLVWVVERAQRFAMDPRPANLIGLKEGRAAGQWRDSEDGLGGGRFAYDVNAVFVPAALGAIDRLIRSGLLDPYVSDVQRRALLRAGPQQRIWAKNATPLFRVTTSSGEARARVVDYARAIGVDSQIALAALGERTLAFNALSLNAAGQPVPIIHSDDGFALLFGMPAPDELERAIAVMMRPFPAGLLTPLGLLVANPAFADPDLQRRFTSSAYHGTVVWSWQQAVLVAGIERQLARSDLEPSLRARLTAARAQMWSAIESARELRTSELWSWSFSKGAWRIEPFGQRGADVDESNAAQLWSTVFLAVRPSLP
jgi:hypothetical protein